MDVDKLQKTLKILVKKKEMLFQRVQRMYGFAKKRDESARQDFETAYTLLEKTLVEFDEVEMKINEISLEIDDKFEPGFNMAIRDLVEYIERVAAVLIDKPKKPAEVATNALVKTEPLKLKKIEIPKFDGSQASWPVFYELFRTLVYEDRRLSNLEKMHHLTTSLTGSALSVCQNIKPTGDNFEGTWKALVDRYNDIRSLGNSYVESVFDFKPLRAESRQGLINILDKFCAPISALKQLEIADVADFVFLNRGLNILDPVSKRAFEAAYRDKDLPTFQDFVRFLEKQVKTLPQSEKTAIVSASKNQKPAFKPTHSFIVKPDSAKPSKMCGVCKNKAHELSNCPKFLGWTPWQRFKFVKSRVLCIKCLSDQHKFSGCRENIVCKKCSSGHNPLLHFGDSLKSNQTSVMPVGTPTTLCSLNVPNPPPLEQDYIILLSTVVVYAQNREGKPKNIRLLLDSGSQANFLTSRAARTLGLLIKNVESAVVGFGGTKYPIRGETTLKFNSRYDTRVVYNTCFFVVDQIVDKLPSKALDISPLEYLKHLNLADDKFYLPGEIDGVIGAELFPSLLNNGIRIVEGPDKPVAIYTPLGFVVMGKLPAKENSVCLKKHAFLGTFENEIRPLLQNFWELEEVPIIPAADKQDALCEHMFAGSVQRLDTGKYSVSLPFREDPNALGNSYDMACRRYFNLEKRLARSPALKQAYHRVLEDYIEQGHMSVVSDPNPREGYFIPHHAIFKPQSASTPVRVVFDASAKSTSSKSLNDLLFTGPKLQTNIATLLLNFRLFAYALTADIKQMYRQIWINPEDRKYQQIVWRPEPEGSLKIFQINSVVFGIASSPYLALRTILQLVKDEGEIFPTASEVVPRDLYMDDLITSVPTLDKAAQVYFQTKAMFQRGGFQLLKWATNSLELKGQVSLGDRLPESKEFDADDQTCAVLGLRWHPASDSFTFNIELDDRPGTKRNILSTVARIFDPLGFLAPLTLFLKLLIQKLWQENSDWDQPPSETVLGKWNKFQDQCPSLKSVNISRFLGIEEEAQLALIGFADASEDAYGAVVYLKAQYKGGSSAVSFVCAKSKVAPIKVLSIPRLELCGALLLAKLMHSVVEQFQKRGLHPKIKVFTDSTIVLCWLNSAPNRWATFVANRVAKVQDLLAVECWAHIEGKDNPADCLSRGLSPQELVSHPLWWSGPSWLTKAESNWPVPCISLDIKGPPELKAGHVERCLISVAPAQNTIHLWIERFSSFSRLRRSMVYVLRFLRKLPFNSERLMAPSDLDKAELSLCKVVQLQHFAQDIALLEKGKICSGKLQRLAPFLDKEGLIRVGGRLRGANLGYEYAHPVVLPKDCHYVHLLIRFYHYKNIHTGPHLLLSLLRQKFWVLSARSIVRKVCRQCNVCFRLRPKSHSPVMGDLPSVRVSQAKAFLKTGVDFAGPVSISLGRQRKPIIRKAYICLFVCLSTKAVHLELVSELSTPAFLAAFKRFLARRGACSVLMSDCGTNFVGANRELQNLYDLPSSPQFQQAVASELSENRITWEFLPPGSPHFGGLWEANIKAVKYHLFRVIGTQILSYEELLTLLVQIEALLNSRPLCPLSEDPSEPLALTPAHFLTLTPLKTIPAEDLTGSAPSRLSRYQLLDQLTQSFWTRWRKEYLHELQVRSKWTSPGPSIKVGTMVVIKQDNMAPLHWLLGRVEEVFPGRDGVVRVALVRTAKGCFKRPVVKLCPLPSQ